MAFAAVTILMDTLYQHFLLSTPRFPLRNKRKVRSLYTNLSSLQTSLEQDFKVGENDEAIKGLEAQLRDVSVELRFQIEHQLTLFYLGKSMKLRLESAKKLLPILRNRATKDIESMDFGCMLDILPKHFTLPVSGMPAHIKKRVKSFCTQYDFLFEKKVDDKREDDEQQSDDEQEDDDEQETEDEEETDDEQETEDEWESEDDEQQSNNEQEDGDEKESKDEEDIDDEQESDYEQESEYEQDDEDEWETCTEEEQESEYEQDDGDEWETKEEQQVMYMLYEAESIIRQELRAPSYLNQYMKQRIQARHRIRQLFTRGIKLISYINKELLKLKNAYHQSKNSQNSNPASPTRPERGNITVTDLSQHTSKPAIKMVGCDDEFNTIMDKLNQQSSKREIVSIVGMGGIGKTTLARRIYGHASFISHFDCPAWVTISQEYNLRQVFQDLLHSLAPGVCVNNEASNNELAERVYKCLKGRRYLIIIDDIWSTNVWDDLMRCFQDDNNGSRILLTTRLRNVAEYAGSGKNFCHNKCFLGSYESWNLFCNKVSSKRIILSPEFEIIAREIVEKCKGLPLAITVAAGLLSNSKQTFIEWERIAKSVPTLSLDHSNEQCENIIDLSYTFLPHHLKLCFLSLGCFPEDYKVDEDRIVDVWVSEGFLKVLRSKSLEDVARENLQDLVDRNLVLICRKSDDNKLLYQMHDVLRELALREAKKENLLCLKEDSSISLRCNRIQPMKSSTISQPWSIQSRICNYNGITPTSNTSFLIDLLDSYLTTRRLHPHFKFLRALKVYEFINVNNIFLEIVGLVHLRFLSIQCMLNIHHLPLFMLWNLQKLKVYGYSSCGPLDIWGLPQLRNLYVTHVLIVVPPRSVHHNLESIRKLDYRSCTKELFMRIPNLRTLAVDEDRTINLKCEASNWFESLAYLGKLEELEVWGKLLHPKFSTIHSIGMLSKETFLPNLRKLKLLYTKLKWKDMYIVGMLSQLEVLIISTSAVIGRKWKPKDGGFHRLKFLTIYDCNLQCWKATSSHFPVLECVVLGNMCLLKRIPSGFADIVTLKSIKLYKCLNSTISSAKRIQEEQQEYGNNTFTVDILRYEDFYDYFGNY